ncbi:MAG TPA: TetR/AcrR family transcriptional regulator [Actinomycetota bacterium]|nr:TetR/AcrR family transcriptional regulator [Actinomycetota bacterium]
MVDGATVATAAETAPAHRAPGRPRSAQADRAIIDAIVDLLVDRGYREVTIEAVAARAGVAKTTIYRRWPSKAEMVVEAISACKEDCLEVESCAGKTVACSLVRMLSRLSCSRVARILTGLTVEMAHNEELAVAVREGLLKPNREVVLATLRRGVDTGELRPDANLDVVADLLVGPMFFRILVSGTEVTPELASDTVDLVLRGVSPR